MERVDRVSSYAEDMGVWTDKLLPRAINRMLNAQEVNERRQLTCVGLTGTVVEIGFGSGLNLPFLPSGVDHLLAVEPSDVAWGLAEARRAASPAKISRVGLNGESIDLGDASADSVLTTYTLCTIPHPDRALAEISRILKPGGTLHFLEHGLAPDPSVRRWQRRIQPLHGRIAGGCQLNLPIDELITVAGLAVTQLATGYSGWPKSFGYLYRGRAIIRPS